MKFSNFLFFASLAIAAPTADKLDTRNVAVAEDKGLEVRSADLETRQNRNNAVNTIAGALSTLDSTVSTNLGSIVYIVNTLRTNIDANLRVQLEATLEANYRAIATGISQAANTIASVTVNAAGGIGNSVIGLSRDSITSLANSVQILIRILANIRVVLNIAYSDLNGPLFQLVQQEVAAIRQALAPLLQPIVAFILAVRGFAVSVGLSVQGLDSAVSGLLQIVSQLGSIVGLDFLPTSGPGSLPGIGSNRG